MVSTFARLTAGLVLLPAICAVAQAAEPARVLDGFDDPSTWRVVTSNQVSGALRSVAGGGSGESARMRS